jgi:hypothetical protein
MKIALTCRRKIGIILSIMTMSNLGAQTVPALLRSDNTFIQSRLENSDPAGWAYIRPLAQLREGIVLTTNKSALGLGNDDSMTTFRQTTEEVEIT